MELSSNLSSSACTSCVPLDRRQSQSVDFFICRTFPRVDGRIYRNRDGHKACGTMPGKELTLKKWAFPSLLSHFPSFPTSSSLSSHHSLPTLTWIYGERVGIDQEATTKCYGRLGRCLAHHLTQKLGALLPSIWLSAWGVGHPETAGGRGRKYWEPVRWLSYQSGIRNRKETARV